MEKKISRRAQKDLPALAQWVKQKSGLAVRLLRNPTLVLFVFPGQFIMPEKLLSPGTHRPFSQVMCRIQGLGNYARNYLEIVQEYPHRLCVGEALEYNTCHASFQHNKMQQHQQISQKASVRCRPA